MLAFQSATALAAKLRAREVGCRELLESSSLAETDSGAQ